MHPPRRFRTLFATLAACGVVTACSDASPAAPVASTPLDVAAAAPARDDLLRRVLPRLGSTAFRDRLEQGLADVERHAAAGDRDAFEALLADLASEVLAEAVARPEDAPDLGVVLLTLELYDRSNR